MAMTIAYKTITSKGQMSHNRKIKWLHDRRIVTRCFPWSDQPTSETDVYMYYENGTHQCYTLFNSKAKITTYKSLKWHLLVLQFLNENETPEVMEHVFRFIANKENGFVTFFIKQKVLNEMINEVITGSIEPPVNKIRKVIFKPGIILTISEKLKIVGKLIGRSKITEDLIYTSMLEINHEGEKITMDKLASALHCTVRTLHRNMSSQLKQEKEKLNEEV